MLAKNNIAFLLNPVAASTSGGGATTTAHPCTPPSSPPVSFHHKPLCPATIAATSLALLSAVCMSPMTEKRMAQPSTSHALKKRKLTTMSHAVYSSEDDEGDVETMEVEIADVETAEEEDVDEDSSCCESKQATKKKTRTPPCQVDGCKNMAVSRGCCVRHGGGSRCVVAGCANRAKLYKRCFQHGGYKTCQAENCSRKAKRYGYCWSHGGGRICETEGCNKVSTQGGLCWAHGGGNRCRLDGCSRRSYQKYDYFCVDHADHSKKPDTVDSADV